MTTKVRPNPAPRRQDYLWQRAPACSRPMNKLQEFYRKYRQYILSDGLMYGVFILALAIMFLFFR